MRILDIYISRKFLGNLIFTIVAFSAILIIIDGVERLSEYIDKGAPAKVILQYYLYYIPYIVVLSCPIGMLLASMFAVGQMAKYQELLAMKASGISLYRILAPLFALGLIISVFMIYFAETVMPWANTKKAEVKREHIDRVSRSAPSQIANLYFHDTANRRIFIGYYNAYDKVARKVNILELEEVSVGRRIDAELMKWEDEKWVLINAYERNFLNGKETGSAFERWVIADLSLSPEDIARAQKKPEEMSFEELEHFIQQVQRNGGDPNRWLVDLYLKISFPFANLIIVLFGAPLAASRVRSTGAVGVAISMVICFLYFGAIKIGQTLGQTGTLHPMLSAWLGNLIFSAGGLIFLIRAPK